MRIKQLQYKLTQFAIIISLFTVGISPACKFISGQQNGFIEICTAFGIKKIPAPEGSTPLQPENKHKAAEQCIFCVSAQIHKVIANTGVNPDLAPYKIKTAFAVFTHQILRSQRTNSFEARAPPYIS